MGGQWHHCFSCGSSGDMVQLACRAWKLDPENAAGHLAQYGLKLPPAALTEATANAYKIRLNWRRRLDNFWASSQEYMLKVTSGTINRLKHIYKLNHSNESMLPTYFGAANKAALYALSERILERPKTRVRKWNNCLVLPFYNMPGRISGFYFVGRQGEPVEDCFFWPEPSISDYRTPMIPYSDGRREAGLYGLNFVEEGRFQLDGKIIAVPDPMFAARVQIRNLAAGLKPLPIVAFVDDARCMTWKTWQQIGHDVVVWPKKLTASAVVQAVLCHGSLSLAGPEDWENQRLTSHYLSLLTARDLCRRVIRCAKPWREFLREWIDENEDGPVGSLFEKLKSYPMFPMEDVLDALRAQGLRVRELIKTPQVPRHVPGFKGIGARFFYEYADGYYYQPTGKKALMRITDFIVRLASREAVTPERIKYTGTIRTASGFECPFEWVHKDRGMIQAVIQTLLQAGQPSPYMRPGWDRRLLSIATEFASSQVP